MDSIPCQCWPPAQRGSKPQSCSSKCSSLCQGSGVRCPHSASPAEVAHSVVVQRQNTFNDRHELSDSVPISEPPHRVCKCRPPGHAFHTENKQLGCPLGSADGTGTGMGPCPGVCPDRFSKEAREEALDTLEKISRKKGMTCLIATLGVKLSRLPGAYP